MPGKFDMVNYHKGCINKSLKKMVGRMIYVDNSHTNIFLDEEEGLGLGQNVLNIFAKVEFEKE